MTMIGVEMKALRAVGRKSIRQSWKNHNLPQAIILLAPNCDVTIMQNHPPNDERRTRFMIGINITI